MPEALESYFAQFRQNIIGHNFEHPFAGGKKRIIYADWAASGRLYRPIEEYISTQLGPYVANTHTETTLTGTVMTHAYHQARDLIKKHVNASPEDQLLFAGFGMTAAINKFQCLLGLHVHEKYKEALAPAGNDRPLVIITHMEHHSNQISWEECLCDVTIIRRNSDGLPDLEHLHEVLEANRDRRLIIGSFTACSNVTGIITPYHQMAEIMHAFGGYCFIDFSASAPYVEINMHPENPNQQLDAIYFSPHKFLGGPGSSGVVVFNKAFYHNAIPDSPGGGTVRWTNPWGGHRYYDDIEMREDGGTPGFLQAIKASLAVLLKEEMGIDHILAREHQLKDRLMDRLLQIPAINILEPEQRHRLSFVSFYVRGLHHNLIVRLLNDKFGIQTRGGCSCAGTYGHILLNIDYAESKRITDMIDHDDLSEKPGWVRISLHPTMTDDEVEYIADAIAEIIEHHNRWKDEYRFNIHTGDFESLKGSEFRIDLKKTFRGW
ncbi:MAG: aminotransferase class V-fold PLP-dependent enzyme [candidate division KSB1 bacterium]|nr:aminotransferase class V-fold PLP-dependent enzyme [candidate division KSB1 bacterium]MDZ7304375.1 aminotransferase class V-fold PLP-dependent enzyme [candidate division KSB1 bacterium]MDZ7313524.1 aminotransferase class V-fold PLP-dependent enzyme [candidate division KSB1 bacterium]